MIGSLKGKVELKDGTTLIIDVNGVGYKATVAADVLGSAVLFSQIKIYTYTYVREDVLELFGFSSAEDLKLFERIISVSGIGPRSAINIFSVGNRKNIIGAVIKGDVEFFTQVPRLGRKNAQKIIIELRGKLGSLEDLDLSEETDGQTLEVLNVLKTFGFSVKEAKEAMKNIDKKIEGVEEKVRLALKYLGK
ncbi:MAG: Holliday junction branch migration protein RuvA [Candidatus Levybacteria bacterium]|nr:Holliday junction branch migration protein RuvA [Candidatus Levybacteria bacterium]